MSSLDEGSVVRRGRLRIGGAVPALLAAILVLVIPACAHACPPPPNSDDHVRLEPELRRLIDERPDTVVGVLLRLDGPGTAERRDELRRRGLTVGTFAGDIATGRVRACDVPRVAELGWVRQIQMAREVSRPPPPDPPAT